MAKPHHNHAHRQERKRWEPHVNPSTRCALCGKALGQVAWDLAHDDARPGHYLGPAHPSCNRSEARNSPRWKGTRAQRAKRESSEVAHGIGRPRRVRRTG